MRLVTDSYRLLRQAKHPPCANLAFTDACIKICTLSNRSDPTSIHITLNQLWILILKMWCLELDAIQLWSNQCFIKSCHDFLLYSLPVFMKFLSCLFFNPIMHSPLVLSVKSAHIRIGLSGLVSLLE